MSNRVAAYNEAVQAFQAGTPVVNSAITTTTTVFTLFLLLLSFGSLSFTLLGDIKKKSLLSYLISAIVASLSVGFISARAQADEYANDPNIFELTSSNFDKVIHGSNYTSIVKFYAPWCGYCQQLKPVWKKLGKAIGGGSKLSVNVAAVNCDKDYNKPLCAQYQISGFPTVMVFRPPKYDKSKAVGGRKSRHASEAYSGPRTVKAMSQFLSSRLKNYVKKLHNLDKDLVNWVNNDTDKAKVLLIAKSNSISPLLKSLAIDFITKVDFAMYGKYNDQPKTIEIDGKSVDVPKTEFSTLLYLDRDSGKLLPYDATEKLDDKTKISKWVKAVTQVDPVEGPLSNRGKRLLKYKSKKKVEHDEL
ncbi:hypothetical protein KGF57_004899 [Candida theae]|uniref:Thioredoxin domain-containing protein n=1 Tax=Candida theae TaxID=1198502 RepID=A0AAD5BB61_9ASCO|nr:uncharacterized protein KGF57_004899 [Candida theae]KAI5949069.1 hypothetical protein KGF57_004899 [Candida theae]